MTPRSVLRYETWTLQPDREPDAEPVLYAMQCAVDGETSPTSEDFAEPQEWVLRHCGQNPSHHTYREIIVCGRRGGYGGAGSGSHRCSA